MIYLLMLDIMIMMLFSTCRINKNIMCCLFILFKIFLKNYHIPETKQQLIYYFNIVLRTILGRENSMNREVDHFNKMYTRIIKHQTHK